MVSFGFMFLFVFYLFKPGSLHGCLLFLDQKLLVPSSLLALSIGSEIGGNDLEDTIITEDKSSE